jgi:hypothetical protein
MKPVLNVIWHWSLFFSAFVTLINNSKLYLQNIPVKWYQIFIVILWRHTISIVPTEQFALLLHVTRTLCPRSVLVCERGGACKGAEVTFRPHRVTAALVQQFVLLLLLFKSSVSCDYSCCGRALLISSNSVSSRIFMPQCVMLLSLSRSVSLPTPVSECVKVTSFFKLCLSTAVVQQGAILPLLFNICILQSSSYPVSLCTFILECAILFFLFYIVLLILLF